jgi:tetratricopeptide (TPR) repeat protein
LEDAEQAIAAQEWVRAGLAVDAALASSPLSWQGHYQQGRLALAAGFPENQVRAAFLRARALDPNNPFISYRAGLLWWRNDRRDLALSCWNDALADARLHRGVVFNQIAQFLREIPGQEVRLAQMAARYPDLRVYALGMVSDEEYGPLAVQLAAGNPLGDAEAFTLFEGWERRRTEPDFEIFLGQHPEWMGQAWPLMARRLARQGDAEGALRILWERVPPPAWPQLDMSVPSIEAARLELRRNPLKIAQAYVVARDQEGGGRYEAALESIEPLLGTEGCPSYFYYLEAALRHSLGQGNEAYAALEKYRKMSKN